MHKIYSFQNVINIDNYEGDIPFCNKSLKSSVYFVFIGHLTLD